MSPAPLTNARITLARDGLELSLTFRPSAEDVQCLTGDSAPAFASQVLDSEALRDLLWRALATVQPQLARAQSELHAAVQVAFLELQVQAQREALRTRGVVPDPHATQGAA